MYAIVNIGSRQYKIKPGDIINVEKIEAKPGKAVTLNKVMLVSGPGKLELGSPFIKGAHIQAEFITNTKAKKTISYKYRRRKSSHTKRGHSQTLSRLQIKKIQLEG